MKKSKKKEEGLTFGFVQGMALRCMRGRKFVRQSYKIWLNLPINLYTQNRQNHSHFTPTFPFNFLE